MPAEAVGPGGLSPTATASRSAARAATTLGARRARPHAARTRLRADAPRPPGGAREEPGERPQRGTDAGSVPAEKLAVHQVDAPLSDGGDVRVRCEVLDVGRPEAEGLVGQDDHVRARGTDLLERDRG